MGFNAANLARLFIQREIRARNPGAERRIDRLHPGMRIGRAADNLFGAFKRLDRTDFQLVRIRVFFRPGDMRHGKGRQGFSRVVDMLNFKTGHGHRFNDLVDGGIGFQMLFQPGQGEFHWLAPAISCVSSSRGVGGMKASEPYRSKTSIWGSGQAPTGLRS